MGFDRTQKNTLKQLYVQKINAIIRMVTGKHIGVVDCIVACVECLVLLLCLRYIVFLLYTLFMSAAPWRSPIRLLTCFV